MNKEEFLKKLEVELKISKNSQYTVRNYLKANSELLEFTKKLPDQITEEDVQAFMAEKLSDKASISTILFLAAIRHAYRNILKKDPTANIRRPKKEIKIPAVLSKDEVRKLISSINNSKSKLMITLMYACGFRVSELISLKTPDLDFNEKIGYARQAKGKKDRIFNIPELIFQDLKEQAEKQKQESQEYLFSGPKGRLSARNLQKIVRTAAKKSGISKPVHCHTLRHSFATHLLENGENLIVIQQLLGHENIETTKIYTHISPQQLKKVKSPIDAL